MKEEGEQACHAHTNMSPLLICECEDEQWREPASSKAEIVRE